MAFSFVVCGYGNIGRRHAAIIAARSDAQLEAIVDIDPGRAQEAHQQWNVPAYPSLRDMHGAGHHPDVVVLAVPNDYHIKMGRAALRNGAHVIVEKPLGLRYRNARRIIQLAREKDRLLACMLQNRLSPIAQWFHQVIAEGRLGYVYHVDIRLIWNRNGHYYHQSPWRGTINQDGGTLYTQFSHFIDLLYWCFGPIESVQAWTDNVAHPYLQIEDIGEARFRFVGGPTARLFFTTVAYDHNLESSITVLGSEGVLQVGGQYFNEVITWKMKDPLPPPNVTIKPNHYGHYVGSAALHTHFYEEFIKALQGKPNRLPPVEDAAELVRMIEQIYQAAHHERIRR